MNKTKSSLILLSFCLPLVSTPLFSAPPSACKGKVTESCQADNSCTWVKAFENKNGSQVRGHCRSKPKKKSTSTSQ